MLRHFIKMLLFCGLWFALQFFGSNLLLADELHTQINDFEVKYQKLLLEKHDFDTKLDSKTRSYVTNPSMRHKTHLTRAQQRLALDYMNWQNEWQHTAPIVSFRDDLITLYHNRTGAPVTPELKNEATQIAFTLFTKTHDLRKQFRMSSIPLWQNVQIDLKMKTRGECHHWAHDLLEFVKPLPRQFFSVSWAESKAGTMAEHNVAVIFPKNSQFNEGFLFDPWRTGGEPFWTDPKKDKHYHWKKWDDYGIY